MEDNGESKGQWSEEQFNDFVNSFAPKGTSADKLDKKHRTVDSRNQTELLTDILEDEVNEITLFNDGMDGYARMKIGDHFETWPMRDRAFRQWLTKQFWTVTGKAPHKDGLSGAISLAEAKANFDGEKHDLHNRFASHGGAFWYDLRNEKWQLVKIFPDGWEVIDSAPILFKRYAHQLAQVQPQRGGDVRLFLPYVNVSTPDIQLLMLVFIVSCFVPDIAHVILVIHGSQGSSKSMLSKLLRRIVDPSRLDVGHLHTRIEEVVQALAHHAFIIFDNVSYVSQEISDLLCKAVTGSGFTKRELYTNDEDIIYSFRRCIGINGINLVSTRPDLLERSLLVELERISPENRRSEEELLKAFEGDLPLILGGIFDTLARAMKIRQTIEVPSLPRMADFALWGCAIAEALGHTKEDFLRAYSRNIEQQKDTALSESPVAQAVLSFMQDKKEYSETPTIFYKELTSHAIYELQIDTRVDSWPKAPNLLSRRLNEISVNLAGAGIGFRTTVDHERKINIFWLREKAKDDHNDYA
jgi:hypothetical protein